MKVKEIGHVAAVVRDLNKSLKMYREMLGIEPWIIQSFVPPFHRETYVREKPVMYTMRIAIAPLGKIYYELVEPLEGPSIYKEFLDTRGEGLHHIGKIYTLLEKVERDLEMFRKMGLKILQRGVFYDSRYYYIDTEPLLGIVYEVVYEPSEIPPEKVYP